MSEKESLTIYFALETFLGLFQDQESNWAYGGAEMQMYYLAREFAETPNVSVVLLTEQTPPQVDHPSIKSMQVRLPSFNGDLRKKWFMRIFPIWEIFSFLNRLVNYQRREKLFLEHKGKAVLLASSFENEDLINTARKKGILTVYRVNGDSLVDSSMTKDSLVFQQVHKRMRMVDALVVQSVYQKEQTKLNIGLDSTIIESCYPIPIEGTFQKKKQVLWVGRCDPIKQPWIFLSLAKRIPECNFVMVMPPNIPILYEQMEREAALLPNVQIFPGMKHEKLLTFYKESSLVASTSFSEGMPNTLIEACFASTPFVSYSLPFGGILESEKIGGFAKGNIDTFEHIVRNYLTEEEERAKTGERAYNYASATWDSKIAVAKYIKLFESLDSQK